MTDLDKLKVCADAVGKTVHCEYGDIYGALFLDVGEDEVYEYDPLTNSDQALELLCWLVANGFSNVINSARLSHIDHDGNTHALEGDMTSPAALRRAIVEAVVKVKGGRDAA